jgi:hypothetical protein
MMTHSRDRNRATSCSSEAQPPRPGCDLGYDRGTESMTYALRACSGALLSGSKPALASADGDSGASRGHASTEALAGFKIASSSGCTVALTSAHGSFLVRGP